MNKRVFTLAATLGVVLPLAAGAQVAEGLYIGGGVGLNYLTDTDIEGNNLAGDAEFDLGFGLLGVVGYSFGGPRIEGELSYRRNSTDKASVVNTGFNPINTRPDGDFSTFAGMMNFYYDIDVDSIITPYIGAGIGGAFADHEDIGDEFAFAYQGILGASFYIDQNIDAFLDFRYFATTKVAGGDIGRAAEVDNASFTVMAGIRFRLSSPTDSGAQQAAYNPPPPAPPPPPVAAPPPPMTAAMPAERQPAERRFLVFFDFDSASVGGEGDEVIRDAAEASRTVELTRIDVTGHADRAGGARYNQRLSRRRANAVKQRLMANGVAEKDIIIYARGEEDPLVPTRDGVREPRNRRVEIVLN